MTDPAGTLTFEVTGANVTELVERAHNLVQQFADGLSYTIDTLHAEPYITRGTGQTMTWRADCRATVGGSGS